MFCNTNESESCLVKAPAKHASESVLVVGELLCTGAQANTERHTKKDTREMCSSWGYKQHYLPLLSAVRHTRKNEDNCTSDLLLEGKGWQN